MSVLDAEQLSDDFPVLLGPVRVETRFTPTELLVRVFPDDWSIDKFEPKPTEAELTAVAAYWTAVWIAGGNKQAEQAAWQTLVGRIAPGRAGWLSELHQPSNPANRPVGDTVVVIVSPQALPAGDRQPTITYWTAVWRAHGDRGKIRNADIALLAAVGPSRASAIRARRPAGLDAAQAGAGDEVVVAFMVFPRPAADQIAPFSWTRAARARLLPDRFAVLGYVGAEQVLEVTGAAVPDDLPVSPDPGSGQLKVLPNGTLQIPDVLRWLVDFDRAVQIGMGIRIPLDDRIRDGLDRLVVVGLRLTSGPDQAATELADLIYDQHRSSDGFSLLPQGTPTNNTESAPAGRGAGEVPEAGLRAAAEGDWRTKTDGQWFAELLGIDPARLVGVPNSDGTDQRDARAANTALWPATWGNFLRAVLDPILSPEAVEQTRQFFVRHVSGRGPVPAFKVGRQPYGVLPTTAFSRLAWPETATHRRRLHTLLGEVAQDWRTASANVAYLGKSGDPHQLLLEILALHPTSAEFYQRHAQSVEDIFNRENLDSGGPNVLPALTALNMPQPVRALLARLGHPGPQDPAVIRRLFVDAQHPLLGPLVDDRPLSEMEPLQRNYLSWLAANARTNLDAIRLEDGFPDGKRPAALLYLLLRHAVMLTWEDAARKLNAAAGLSWQLPTADPLFVHIRPRPEPPAAPSESRFWRLYSTAPEITGNPDQTVAEFIPSILDEDPATAQLAEQIDALDRLVELPTAKLERVLTEHLDCATYRFDAWRLGQANDRLSELRYGTEAPRRGVHIGAYGWLEEVRPRTAQPTTVELTGKLKEVFAPPGSAPILHDSTNGGYVHAPSLNHATTAAVLRAGYLANASPANPGTFAVNLTSERVRVALTMLDGLRQGQSLGALLGYRLERGLHDRHADAEVDKFIKSLREVFPLRSGKLAETAPADRPSIELVEARNVVEGLELVKRVTRTEHKIYPFGFTGLEPANGDETKVITEEVDRLLDIHDALADLAVAEGAHQTLMGNTERASATLDAFAKEGFPPDPAVIQTPRSGVTLTHRLALALRPGLNPALRNSPRAKAEPAVDDWLPSVLPGPLDVAALVTWQDPVGGATRSRVVTQQDAGLQPIDLLWALRPESEAAMTDLDDRIIGVVVERSRPRPDAVLTIHYTQRVGGKVTFFELSPLIAALRSLLTTSRPLRSSDLVPAAGAKPVDRPADEAVALSKARPVAVRDALVALRAQVVDYLADLGPLIEQPAGLIETIDTFLGRYAGLVVTAGGFGMARSGWGELTAWRRGVYAEVLAAVAVTTDRMGKSLAAADALIAQYDALPSPASDDERFRLLEQAERLLTTEPTKPRPARPSQLRTIVRDRRGDFDDRLQALRDIAETTESTLSGLLTEVADLLPLSEFDATGLDLEPFEKRIVGFAGDLRDRATALVAEIADRVEAAGKELVQYDQAVAGPDRVQAATDALRALLGEDVLAIPEFTPPEDVADEWQDARGDSDDLVEHLTQAPFDRDFPVDDWVHGVARVREKPRLWEQAIMLSDALRGKGGLLGNILGWQEPPLQPVQFPHREDDSWLGMEFKSGYQITEDKLLFTAHYATGSTSGDSFCGLLLDEWTEVIPADQETTGIAVGFDRPDSEPPQTLLLITPPAKTGNWSSDDLVAAIHETFDLARLRAVEPEHLDATAYAQLLPATVLSATRQPITISTDLALNNLRWKPDALGTP